MALAALHLGSASSLSPSSSPPSSCLYHQKWGCRRPSTTRPFPLPLIGASQQPRRHSSSSSSSFHLQARTNARAYQRLDSCVVVPPPPPIKPRAILLFLGGAFVGAVPEYTYRYLMEMLADEGFLVLSIPYDVTFDYFKVAEEIFNKSNRCLDLLLSTGFTSANASIQPAHLARLPVFSVGHSNGALLQLLIGSCFSDRLPKANAVISFNNRPVSEAVPYFDQLGPAYGQIAPIVEASPLSSIGANASGDALRILGDAAEVLGQAYYDPEAMISLNKFVDQLPSVFNQVKEGVSEFKPTPGENRDILAKSYNVVNTLLVKFDSDTIDETDRVEEILEMRVKSFGGILEKVSLSGNHLTPCVQDLKWQVGRYYTPTDAIVQGLKSLALIETKALSRTITDWLNRFVTN